MSLVENINKRRKAGTSRSKSKSTINPKAYKAMQKGWTDKKANGGIPKGPGMGVRQRIANAANLGRNIARKPIGDPTGQGLKGKTLTGGTMQIKRNVGTRVPETKRRGGVVPSSAETSVIKGATVRGSREGSTIKGPKAKGSREGSVIKAKDGKWIQKAIKKPGALRASLGVKKGKDIPAKKLDAAAKKKGKMGQRARLAKTLKSFK